MSGPLRDGTSVEVSAFRSFPKRMAVKAKSQVKMPLKATYDENARSRSQGGSTHAPVVQCTEVVRDGQAAAACNRPRVVVARHGADSLRDSGGRRGRGRRRGWPWGGRRE